MVDDSGWWWMMVDDGEWYPLIMTDIANWKDPPCDFYGKIHYFDWAMFNNYVKLPEGSGLVTKHLPESRFSPTTMRLSCGSSPAWMNSGNAGILPSGSETLQQPWFTLQISRNHSLLWKMRAEKCIPFYCATVEFSAFFFPNCILISHNIPILLALSQRCLFCCICSIPRLLGYGSLVLHPWFSTCLFASQGYSDGFSISRCVESPIYKTTMEVWNLTPCPSQFFKKVREINS